MGKVIVAVILAILIIPSASGLVTAVSLTMSDAVAIPQAYGHSHVEARVPQINLVCSDKPFSISAYPNAWDQAFANGYKIKLVTDPGVKDYKYANTDNNAIVRIMCDPNKYYFLGEYIIPSDSGSVTDKPAGLVVYVDTMDHKNSVPQKEDYKFGVVSNLENNRYVIKGLTYSQGMGNLNQGYSGWSDPPKKISDITFAKSGDSFISTSIFEQPHLVYFLELSKSYDNFNIQNPFGLGFWIADFTSVNNHGEGYNAYFPSNLYHVQSSTWAEVYSSYLSQTTTTSQLTTLVTTSRSSIQENQTIPAQGGLSFFDLHSQNFLLTATAIVIVAVLVALCAYRYMRKPDRQHV